MSCVCATEFRISLRFHADIGRSVDAAYSTLLANNLTGSVPSPRHQRRTSVFGPRRNQTNSRECEEFPSTHNRDHSGVCGGTPFYRGGAGGFFPPPNPRLPP